MPLAQPQNLLYRLGKSIPQPFELMDTQSPPVWSKGVTGSFFLRDFG